MGGRHDAATGTGDDHEVVVRKRGAQLTRRGVQRMFDRCARGTEYRDLAPALELVEAAECMLHLAHGLQQDLGVPAAAIGLRHACDGHQHFPVQRQVGTVGRNDHGRQLIDLAFQFGAAGLEVSRQIVIRIKGHTTSPCMGVAFRL